MQHALYWRCKMLLLFLDWCLIISTALWTAGLGYLLSIHISNIIINITILNIATIFPITITNNTFSCWYLIIPTASRRQDWIISHLPTPAHIININQDQSNFQRRKNFGYKVQFRIYLCTLDFKRAHQILLSDFFR